MAVCERPQKPPFSPRTCAGDPGIIGIIPKRSPPDCNLIVAPGPPLIGSMQLNVLPPILAPPQFGCVLPFAKSELRASLPADADTNRVFLDFVSSTVTGSTDPCDLKLEINIRLPPLVFDMNYDTWPLLIDAELTAADWVITLGKLSAADWATFPIDCTGGGGGMPGCDGPVGPDGPEGPSLQSRADAELLLIQNTASTPVTGPWVAIDAGDAVYVAVGNGVASYSVDGASWAAGAINASLNWFDVAYGSGSAVAVVGIQAPSPPPGDPLPINVNVSTNGGSTWTDVRAPEGAWTGVRYLNCIFFAFSDSVTSSARIMSSEDTAIWTVEATPGSSIVNDIGYSLGKYIAVGTVALFKDSVNTSWTVLAGLTGTWNTIIPVGTDWIATSSTQSALSTDGGVTWVISSINADASNTVYAGGLYVTNGGKVSLDAVLWKDPIDQLTDIPNNFIDMVYLNKVLHTVGASTALRNANYSIHLGNNLLPFVAGAEPVAPAEGDVYFDDTTKKHRGYDGTTWNNLY